MLNLADRSAIFDLRVHQTETMFEKWGQIPARKVAVLVNCGGQYSSAVFAVPDGVISSATKE
jgi:hypothetical protein